MEEYMLHDISVVFSKAYFQSRVCGFIECIPKVHEFYIEQRHKCRFRWCWAI